jgi:predicted Zn-dependent protease
MSALPRRVTVGGAALVVLACGDIGSPTRNDFYEWRLIVPSASGPDTVSFHWTQDRLPVRIWVAADEAPDLPAHVQHAIDMWESAYLYGEYRAQIVSDSNAADVIVRGIPAPLKAEAQISRLHSALAPECGGATDLDIDPELTELTLPMRVYVDPRVALDTPSLATCLSLTTIHELGHTLGIFAHSEDPEDIMYADPQVEQPSERDLGTAEVIYHLLPTIEVVGP